MSILHQSSPTFPFQVGGSEWGEGGKGMILWEGQALARCVCIASVTFVATFVQVVKWLRSFEQVDAFLNDKHMPMTTLVQVGLRAPTSMLT